MPEQRFGWYHFEKLEEAGKEPKILHQGFNALTFL